MLSLAGIAAFLGVAILLMLLVWVAATILIRVTRALFTTVLFRDFQPSSLVLALGITALVFGDVLEQVVEKGGEVMLLLFAITANAIAQGITQGSWNDEPSFSRNLEQLHGSLTGALYTIPVGSLLVLFAVFVVLAGAVDGGKDEGKHPSLARFRNWYSNLKPNARHRVVLGATFVAGAYLSLAAIIAVPWLQSVGKAPKEALNELRQRLESERPTGPVFDARWPRELPTKQARDALQLHEHPSPSAAGSNTVTTNTVTTNSANTANPSASTPSEGTAMEDVPAAASAVLADAEKAAWQATEERAGAKGPPDPAHLARVRASLDEAEQHWADARTNYTSTSASLLQQALDAYERYAESDLTDRERQLFLDSLVQWYRERLSLAELQLGWYKRDVEGHIYQLASIAKHPPLIDPFVDSSFKVPDTFSDAVRTIANAEVPSPKDVTGLGIFGFIANWLVRTRSFSLALISGMIGFGLFGSALSRTISRALRQEITKTEQTIAQEPPFDILVVGISAAVIVFLASQGGLAIVATGGSQTVNPYVLFLGCFLAAVFGERFWETARARFYRGLEEAEQRGNGSGNAGGSGSGNAPIVPPATVTAPAVVPAPTTPPG